MARAKSLGGPFMAHLENLNNIPWDMILLQTSYGYGVFLEYYFKLQFSSSWSIHGKALP